MISGVNSKKLSVRVDRGNSLQEYFRFFYSINLPLVYKLSKLIEINLPNGTMYYYHFTQQVFFVNRNITFATTFPGERFKDHVLLQKNKAL
jgi:hypothetical protein